MTAPALVQRILPARPGVPTRAPQADGGGRPDQAGTWRAFWVTAVQRGIT